MSSTNPHFRHVDGAAYQLSDLIKTLGSVPYGTQLDENRRYMAEAIVSHARNVQELLLEGMHSIGHLMVLAGGGEHEVESVHVMQLGALLKHLASETDFLRATESDMKHILKEQTTQPPTEAPARARASRKQNKEK